AAGDDGHDVEETVTAGLAGLFRARSRRLLAELLRPHRQALLRVGLLVVVSQAASLAGPLLVRLGIDRGIPPLLPGGSGDPTALSVVTIGTVLVVLDPPLGLVSLASLPPLFAATRWYRRSAERAYRAIREAVALVIMFFVESLSGVRAVHAFRREGRNQEIFSDLNDRYRQAN